MAFTDAKKRPQGTFDAALLFNDGVAATIADGGGVVESAARTVDVGAGLFKGTMVFDVTAIDISSTDETYAISVQGSNDGFSTAQDLCLFALSAAATSTVGRYKLHFDNEFNGVFYKELRTYVDVGGTSPSITYKAYAIKQE